MDSDETISLRPSSRPTSATHNPSLPNNHPRVHSTFPIPINASFVTPPPPPPLQPRINTHSRHTSHADGTTSYLPTNHYSHSSMNHARTRPTSLWIPPPPPPPIGIPINSGASNRPTFNPLESTLQLSLLPPPPPTPPSLLIQNATPQMSAYSYVDRETHSLGHGQAHHSRNKSVTVPNSSHYSHHIPSSFNQAHIHVVNYNTPPSQFSPSRPSSYANHHPSPNNASVSSSGSDPSHHPHLGHPQHPHHSYIYPTPPHFPPGTVQHNMMLTRPSPPFEQGPFAASSVPPQPLQIRPPTHAHAHHPSLSHSHTSTPSFSQSQSHPRSNSHSQSQSQSPQQSTPPPPRPPKPSELEGRYDATSAGTTGSTTATTLPILPERLHHQGQRTTNVHSNAPPPPLPPLAPAMAMGIRMAAWENFGVGVVESPSAMMNTPRDTMSKTRDAMNLGRLGEEEVDASNEDVNASNAGWNANADGSDKVDGDKVSGNGIGKRDLPAIEASQANTSIQGKANGDSRHLGVGGHHDYATTSRASSDPQEPLRSIHYAGLAGESNATPEEILRERGGSIAEGGWLHRTISASGDEGTSWDAGDDGVDGMNEEGEGEDMDGVRRDSGMTMESYDPNAFDFPRRVNDEMVHVLYPTTTQIHPSSSILGADDTVGTTVLSREREEEITSAMQRMASETEGEAPPTYDQVELEAQLNAQSPTTPIASSHRPGEPNANVITPIAQYLSPMFASSSSSSPIFIPPTSPPPAFRPQTPPTPDGGGGDGDMSNTAGTTTSQVTPTRGIFQATPDQYLLPQSSGKHPAAPTRPIPPLLMQYGANVNRAQSTSGSSSGHGHEGLMMTSGDDAKPGSSKPATRPAIYTSPPSPSLVHSPSNSVSRSPPRLKSLPLRRFTTGSVDKDSMGSRSPTSESSDPFQDPASFQPDNSPFALNQNGIDDSPRSVPTEVRSHSQMSDNAQYVDGGGGGGGGKSTTWQNRSRSYSGLRSNVSSTPTTPKSDLTSHELGRLGRRGDETTSSSSHRPLVTAAAVNSSQAVVNAENIKSKRRATMSGSNSRISLFFNRSSVGGGSGSSPPGSGNGNGNAAGGSARNSHVPPVPRIRAAGVDLLEDGSLGDTWQEARGQLPGPDAWPTDPTRMPAEGGSPGEEREQTVLMSLWEGIEFGFGAPAWNTPPARGPYSNPAEWPEGITLYPVGSKPFFVRAPTWRSLLRFLASQSSLRIEPSVEALATSRTPTIDLRLVVQFARTPFTPRGTTRDVCLYMMLHVFMPAAITRVGRALPGDDRVALEKWDTKVLPYGFVCAEGGLLARRGAAAAKPKLAAGASELEGTPIKEQDPDGEASMFITIPPPFIELPVKMSDVAMYLHECLVLSRKNGKSGRAEASGLASPLNGKLRKGHGSSANLPADGTEPSSGNITTGGVHLSTPFSTLGEEKSAQTAPLSEVPGLKRLAKAVKTFYPEEYAIGSSRANQAAEQAAREEDQYKGKVMSVTGKGKGLSSGKSGGLLGAFHRVKSRSSATVSGLDTTTGGRSLGRDTNAERFELVTPWRE